MVVEAHKHCAICGKPIPMSESFCSDQCQEAYQLRQKQVGKQRKMLYILVAIFVIIYLAFMFLK
jgi:predicted nucleic acid-binding Zn ribbon protein